jgi:AcrR family transcriptional regulator
MATQVGLDHSAVIGAAAGIADEDGLDALTLARLAGRLGIRSQSLYAHVDGLDGLQRDLALHAVHLLGEELRSAAIGRSGRDALLAMAYAYRSFATRHPGLYTAAIRPPGDDEELRVANQRAAEAMTRVLESFGLGPEDTIHMYRAIWSAIHGFVALEQSGVMTLSADPEESFRRMVGVFADALDPQRS